MSNSLRVKRNLVYYTQFSENNKNDKLPHYSDKLILPQSFLEEIVNQQYAMQIQELPHPLIVEIKSTSSGLSCYAGVKEFSSDDMEVILPKFIVNKLKLDQISEDTEEVVVELIDDIQKGTSLTLKQMQMYPEVNDWKWFLEANLVKSYTTLTSGDSLQIEDTGKVYEFKVIETQPKFTICVVDTDINLEVEPLDDNMAKELLEKRQTDLLEDSAQIILNNENRFASLTVSQDHTKKLELNLEGLNKEKFKLVLTTSKENVSFADIVVSGNPYVSETSFVWSTFISSSKEIEISSSSPFIPDSKRLYILPLVHDIEEPVTIHIEIGEVDAEMGLTAQSTELGSDQARCSNCGSIVSKSALFMHENFCLRNNVKCPKGCNRIFLREIPTTHWHCQECSDLYGDDEVSYKNHQLALHTPMSCQKCEEDTSFSNLVQLALHSATECAGLLHECRFCHLILPREASTPMSAISGMSHHEYTCGSRTTECDKCKKIIKLRDLVSHEKLHDIHRIQSIKPIKCSNYNCCRTIPLNDTTSNPIGLCTVCFGPSYSGVFDPDNSKLKSRLERRYVLQITKGCGNSWCKNPECFSSGLISAELKSAGIGGAVKHVKQELLTMIPNLPGSSPSSSSECCWFCVDLSTIKKKMVVDFLLEENFYALEWICQAVTEVPINVEASEMESLNKLKDWLSQKAVRIDESG